MKCMQLHTRCLPWRRLSNIFLHLTADRQEREILLVKWDETNKNTRLNYS